MWMMISIWAVAAAALCAGAGTLLRLQPVGAKPGPINSFAGLMLGPGLRIVRGGRNLVAIVAASWALWAAAGAALIALIAPGYDPHRMNLIYGLLCGIAGAVAGAALGVGIGLFIVKLTNMSSFEGKSGFFVAFVALAMGLIGFLAAGIGMSIYFHSRSP